MTRYAEVIAGVVTGVYVATAEWAAAHPGAVEVAADSAVGPGWRCSAGVFAPPPADTAAVPERVTRRQARLAFVLAGYSLSSVDTLISSLPEPKRSIVHIYWNDSDEIERCNPYLNELAPMLNITPAQLDLLFIAAAQL